MQIAFVLYPGFTALDIVGPFQTLADLPGVEAVFVAEQAGPITDHTGALTIVATKALSEVPAPNIVVFPGGPGERVANAEHPIVVWLRAVHPTTTWTTSVCTGSLFLGHAGLLHGVDATCHWNSMDRLAATGAIPTGQRVVERGKIITAAGVSSGIDMGLTLVGKLFGDDIAKAVQLFIEYDPQPPYDAGSPEKAGPELVALVRDLSTQMAAAGKPV